MCYKCIHYLDELIDCKNEKENIGKLKLICILRGYGRTHAIQPFTCN